jgi:hypothetical protein
MQTVNMERVGHWMGTPRAAGVVAGSWCWAAASLAFHAASPSVPAGTELVRWLASDGPGPGIVPLAVAALVSLVHAMLIREAAGDCWIDAAWSIGLVAAGIAAWTWALHHEAFADPFSTSRRLAALAGLGALLVSVAMILAAAAAVERRVAEPLGEGARAVRGFRRSYEAIG